MTGPRGRRRGTVALAAALVAALAACGAPPAPEGIAGRGLLQADEVPPGGAQVFGRPTWTVGDRYVYRRGGLVDVTFEVVEASDAVYRLEEQSTGLQNTFTRDLWVTGQSMPGDASLERGVEPYDAQLTWPLWVGKTWVCHYVRTGGGGELPVIARYECDALETVTTPAGEFACLRIWRRTRPAIDEQFYERNDLLWYAPEAGFFVRRLEDGMLTELQQLERTPAR